MVAVPVTVTTDRGFAPARWLLRVFGWRVRYAGTPAGCGVIIAYPHTSNWDFIVGIMARWAIGLPVAFLGKDSLFTAPVLGRFMRWCGGIPVQRTGASGAIDDMTKRIHTAAARGERWWLAIAPEGTRSRSEDGWRSGFYHIAVAAQVPIGLAYFNFQRKEIGVTTYLQPSGNADADLPQIARWYAAHAAGRHPDLATPVRLKRSR
ncbi:MAG: 1-acyl-sn-glycerol-3-phosphate acyltransferase [Rhodoferax sp.]|nr:1-acyl-sn-glycerol-3-phosphate acyltransferase [Rhodoferax sp.]